MEINEKPLVLSLHNLRLSLPYGLRGRVVSLALGFVAATIMPCTAETGSTKTNATGKVIKDIGSAILGASTSVANSRAGKQLGNALANATGAYITYRASNTALNSSNTLNNTLSGQQQFMTLPNGTVVPINAPTTSTMTLPNGTVVPTNAPTTALGTTTSSMPQTVTLANGEVVTIANPSTAPVASAAPATFKSAFNTLIGNVNSSAQVYSNLANQNIANVTATVLAAQYPIHTVNSNGQNIAGIVVNSQLYPLYQSPTGSVYPYYINLSGQTVYGEIVSGAFYVKSTATTTGVAPATTQTAVPTTVAPTTTAAPTTAVPTNTTSGFR